MVLLRVPAIGAFIAVFTLAYYKIRYGGALDSQYNLALMWTILLLLITWFISWIKQFPVVKPSYRALLERVQRS